MRRVEAEEAAARALSHHLAATLTPPQVRPASREWFEGRGVSTSRVIDPTHSPLSLHCRVSDVRPATPCVCVCELSFGGNIDTSA